MVCLLVGSCKDEQTYHFYSPGIDKSITVINGKGYRYIIAGKYDYIPDTNYVKVDLGKIDKGLGDEIAGCWNGNGLDWSIVMNGVTILENKLDKNSFKFEDNFSKDEMGIPTLIDFNRKQSGCFSISFEYGKLRTMSGAISE